MSLMDVALCCPPVTDAVLDEDQAAELSGLLKALADPVRIRLVSLLAAAPNGELCACDLPELLDRAQPTVSHHLSQLTKAGIVEREQRGKWAWFRLRPEQLSAVCVALGGSAICGPDGAPQSGDPSRSGS
ncbi:ArsR/SmtB family transcription factor [Actinomarinicola tropica]|uniref:Metalloregulator ArsR/SmtB family transcription factor n=1 Tax=Actinomarinicola tropica TaxID=2789776 RepID=A0A5Q2RLF4_9ACTN|nr:metalloregulator ArsR/SmtB family transcription factor [Actinomarinicola tropica]QGG94897.1 metalloregulator ArsR/SmtB family transcription factor [Actinomarinicola tropica]